jgi:CBS domain containing-hemolysin-like protein
VKTVLFFDSIPLGLLLNVVVILFLIAVNAFFVLTEFAYLTVRRSRIDELILNGKNSAVLVKKIINNLDDVLSSAQLGITISTIGLGFIIDDTLSQIFPSSSSPGLVFGIVLILLFLILTSIQMILGELAPKSIALQYSEPIALLLVRPTLWSTTLFKPLILTLNGSSWILLKMLGLSRETPRSSFSADELKIVFKKGVSNKLSEKNIEAILENTLYMGTTPIKEIMTPKSNIVSFSITIDLYKALELVTDSGFSRFPVFKDTQDNMVGIINSKDIFNFLVDKELFNAPDRKEHFKSVRIDHLIRNVTHVPETMTIRNIFDQFKLKNEHLFVVVNEFGGVEGIVTLEDVLESLVGDIQDEHDVEIPLVVQLQDNVFEVNAKMRLSDFNNFFNTDFKSLVSVTIGGYLIEKKGTIPEKDDVIQFNEFNIRILDSAPSHIKKIIVETTI